MLEASTLALSLEQLVTQSCTEATRHPHVRCIESNRETGHGVDHYRVAMETYDPLLADALLPDASFSLKGETSRDVIVGLPSIGNFTEAV